ncbi:MAG: hypothetical protein KJO88_11735, partial [Gammaproteobacteria bacterium]|nr:hypothetical protein [Gammaproteobacteria bacterium]
DTTYTFELVVTDNEGSSASDSVDVIVSPAPSSVTITGKATYDNVPHNTVTNGLNYAGTTQDPIRRAVVELIQGATIIHSDLTDIDGNYSFTVNPNSGSYFVRIKARTLLTGAASWDVLVVDNTNSQAIYALDGSSFEVLTSDINRPTMNAGSGWGGSSYTGARAAAPFHILDRLVDGKLKLLAVDPNLTMPSVDVNWSVNNSPTSGSSDQLTNLRNGDIGTSFYSTFPSSAAEFAGPQFFILGTQDVDTDEYDGHVVVHEWGHYFENVLSRSDSLGGAHAGGDRLDMRVAFGEGFGNAWSAIITDDTFYRDSLDSQQSQGFSFNMESNSWSNPGWYSEGSVQSALYDFYDSADDGVDTLSLGLAPIYEVLTGLQITTEAFTSIFSFSEYLRQQNSGDTVAINAILAGQSITGDGIYGLNETNDAGAVPSSNVLPVYTELVVDGGFKQLCSVDDYDSTGQTANSGNKLSNFRFVYFTIPSNGNYSFLVSSGATQDIDMPIYQMGQDTGFFAAPGGDGDPGDAGDSTFTMTAGNYTAEVYEFDNTFRGNTANSSDECFTVEIVTAP